jgi:hypothetical protein
LPYFFFAPHLVSTRSFYSSLLIKHLWQLFVRAKHFASTIFDMNEWCANKVWISFKKHNETIKKKSEIKVDELVRNFKKFIFLHFPHKYLLCQYFHFTHAYFSFVCPLKMGLDVFVLWKSCERTIWGWKLLFLFFPPFTHVINSHTHIFAHIWKVFMCFVENRKKQKVMKTVNCLFINSFSCSAKGSYLLWQQ